MAFAVGEMGETDDVPSVPVDADRRRQLAESGSAFFNEAAAISKAASDSLDANAGTVTVRATLPADAIGATVNGRYIIADPRAEVIQTGPLNMQVCVPAAWTDAQVEYFANSASVCGTPDGWRVAKKGAPSLAGCDERVVCGQRSDCVHVALDA